MPSEKGPKRSKKIELSDEDAVGYMLGTLSPEDLARVEAKIKSSPELAEEMAWLKAQSADLEGERGEARLDKFSRRLLWASYNAEELNHILSGEISSEQLSRLSPGLKSDIEWLKSRSASWEGLKGDALRSKINDLIKSRKYDLH